MKKLRTANSAPIKKNPGLPAHVPTQATRGLVMLACATGCTHEKMVNGKPALEWVMERQCVKTDLASGIVNDANRYAIETVGDPAYPFKLFCRIITVSLETMKIVRGLPGLDISEPETGVQR